MGLEILWINDFWQKSCRRQERRGGVGGRCSEPAETGKYEERWGAGTLLPTEVRYVVWVSILKSHINTRRSGGNHFILSQSLNNKT